jgi:hypothetical protein
MPSRKSKEEPPRTVVAGVARQSKRKSGKKYDVGTVGKR